MSKYKYIAELTERLEKARSKMITDDKSSNFSFWQGRHDGFRIAINRIDEENYFGFLSEMQRKAANNVECYSEQENPRLHRMFKFYKGYNESLTESLELLIDKFLELR